MKNLLKHGCLGLMVSTTISSIIGLFFIRDPRITKGIVSVMVFGFIIGISSMIYDIPDEKLSLRLKTFIHLLVEYLFFVLINYINQWITFNLSIFISFTIIFVVLYFIIWFGFYLYNKKLVDEINKKLDQM